MAKFTTAWTILVTVLVALSCCVFILYRTKKVVQTPVKATSEIGVTIRLNTFRRNDLLKQSLDHYLSCPCVREIQVVWSDQAYAVPQQLVASSALHASKLKYEIHNKDSLNNRFLNELIVSTQAVLSLDDDLIIPCEDLSFALGVWKSNERALVGFSPRMHTYNPITDFLQYNRWQHTWWNGFYSIVLTKAALFHRDYLNEFSKLMSISMRDYIDTHRNCEDIAMAHVIAYKSRSPPVWVRGRVYEIGKENGISSGNDHFAIRSECLTALRNFTSLTPWITGYQKSVPFGYGNDWNFGLADYLKLSRDLTG